MSRNCLKKTTVHNAEGWMLSNGEIQMFLTRQGGQHSPVSFFANSAKPVQPYFLNPWQEKTTQIDAIPLLQNLRGDFFCLPFGGNGDAVNGRQYQCHGETAAGIWTSTSATEKDGCSRFTFSIDTEVQPIHVEKAIEMHRGESALYIQHTVSGLEGKMPYGHHAILQYPDDDEKMYFSSGKFDLGMTPTSLFSDPRGWEYQYLASGASFRSLEKIPTMFKTPDTCDFSTYPSPAGYADLFSLMKKPCAIPAWSVAVYPRRGYLFFSLKDAAVLPATTIWISNSGRYEYPWNGVTKCFAIEETCSYFADGWKPSIRPNALTKLGWKTCGTFQKDKPFSVRVIQGVARVPRTFGKVKNAKFSKGAITFTDEKGKTITTAVDWEFLFH